MDTNTATGMGINTNMGSPGSQNARSIQSTPARQPEAIDQQHQDVAGPAADDGNAAEGRNMGEEAMAANPIVVPERPPIFNFGLIFRVGLFLYIIAHRAPLSHVLPSGCSAW